MGNNLLCSRGQEIVPDFQFKIPEKKITTKIEESFDAPDELNIIEQIKTNKTNNNNIEQINTKSIIIENEEVMYQRFDTIKKEPKQNNFFYNSNLINDKEGPQDNIKLNENQIPDENINNNLNNLTEKKIESDIPLDTNEINKKNRYTDLVIDQNKIIFMYISDIKEENDINNIDINNNKENNNEIINTNEINIINNDEKEPIEKRIQDLVENSKNIEKDFYSINNNNEIKLQENENNNINNIDNEINVVNNKLENINYIQENNNKISQKNEFSENSDNINIEYIFPEKDFNQIQKENSPTSNISYTNNNSIQSDNLSENPTFFPKSNNIQNNIDNSNTYNNILNNNYISESTNNINQNTEQIYQNNNIVETYSNKLTNSNTFKNTKETNIIPNNNNNYNYNYLYNIETNEKPLFTDKEIDEMIKQAEKTNYQTISYENINKKEVVYQQKPTNINQVYNNLILTPEKKKVYYPLTPDYQTNNKKNDIIYYDINNYLNNKKVIGNKNNINNHYTSIYNQPKTKNNYNYNYNPINYNTPKKSNNNISYNYLYSSPAKKNINTNNNQTSQIIYQSPIKVTQPLIQYKQENNTPLINKSYLKSIQNMNKSIYNVNSISSLYSDITNLNSSFISSCSKSPKKYDKRGNPIYFTSTTSSKKLKDYQNSQILKRNNYNKIKSLSYDDIRKSTNNNYNDDISSNKSPISSLYKNQNKNYNLYSINSNNSLKSYKNMKQNQISRASNINNNMRNMSILNSTTENAFLGLDETTKQIINKYITTDITSTSNFFPDNYKLFYPSSNEYFKIPEPFQKKQIKYYINNDPSKIAIYTGGINKLNKRHGLGQLKESYLIKIGTWKNNEFNGWGRIIYNNGQVLEGKYYKGKLNGKGAYKYKDVLYIGDFRDNIREGKGVLLNKKFRYKGQFNMGKIDGYGKIVFLENKEDVGEYEGFFKENNIEGKGTMKWKNGNVYQGEMKNGKMNGYGKFIPYQGIPIEGIFRDNVRVNIKK